MESTTVSPTTNTFEPSSNNIALTLTGGEHGMTKDSRTFLEEQANFVDRLNEVSNNTTSGIDTFHRTPEFDELDTTINKH